MFGPHLILDGSQCDTQKLGDRILIEQILTDYPAAIGMTRIGGPYMFEYQAPDPAYSGVSGIVVIAESHIAIHTFPALDYFSMDIFSCKNFDHERAIKYIEDALDVKHMDRMLVQRGLSFRGPHHGANGATDELIAAAEARLAAGIVSNETVTPEEAAVARAQLIARHGATRSAAHGEPPVASGGGGRMIWPQYGVTPDIGTYGVGASAPETVDEGAVDSTSVAAQEATACEPCARGGALVVPLDGVTKTPTDSAGQPLPPTTPVQVNPTASISGLLDKLGGVSAGGRALSRALAEWERLARDPGCALVLALSTPVIADGMREVLVYAIEHGYVDVVVLTAADLRADLHEALGHVHYLAGDTASVAEADAARTDAFIAEFATAFVAVHREPTIPGHELLRALSEALAPRAPRKNVLCAAFAAGVSLYCPDLATSAVGLAMTGARMKESVPPRLDPLADVVELGQRLGATSRVGMIGIGSGTADALVRQALTLPVAASTALASEIALGVDVRMLASERSKQSTVVCAEAALALPLLITSLAQRLPEMRARRTDKGRCAQPMVQEPALP